jgi:hypothetical protein
VRAYTPSSHLKFDQLASKHLSLQRLRLQSLVKLKELEA